MKKQMKLLVAAALCLPISGSVFSAQRPPPVINMAAVAWQIRYSPGLPIRPNPNPSGGSGWSFSFPTNAVGKCPAPPTQPPNYNISPCSHVDYVTTPYTLPITAKSITVTFSIIANSPVYDYKTATNNTCVSPAKMRLLLEHHNDAALNNPVYRWWSNPLEYTLGNTNAAVIKVLLTPDQWSDVNGQLGTTDPADFTATLLRIGAIGMTFGGGCFFSHGVYLDSGSATLTVTDMTLND